MMNLNTSVIPNPHHANHKKKIKYGKAFYWMIGLFIAVVLGVYILIAGAAGFYFYTDYQYSQALACVSGQKYAEAQEHLLKVVALYKDTPSLMMYAQAGDALEHKDYYNAKLFYTSLDTFMESRAMLTEVNYQIALEQMQRKEFDAAGETFANLARKKYKDSAKMALEARYQSALVLMESGGFTKAADLFEELSQQNYKDSQSQLGEANYNVAVGYYHAKKFHLAKRLFETMKDYKKSVKYLLLIKVHLKDYEKYDYMKMKSIASLLRYLDDWEDAFELTITEDLFCYRLEGYWSNNSDWYFSLTRDVKQDQWNINYNIPWIEGKYSNGYYFKVEDKICYFGNDVDGWDKCFEFVFQSDGTLRIRSFKNNEWYYLNK